MQQIFSNNNFYALTPNKNFSTSRFLVLPGVMNSRAAWTVAAPIKVTRMKIGFKAGGWEVWTCTTWHYEGQFVQQQVHISRTWDHFKIGCLPRHFFCSWQIDSHCQKEKYLNMIILIIFLLQLRDEHKMVGRVEPLRELATRRLWTIAGRPRSWHQCHPHLLQAIIRLRMEVMRDVDECKHIIANTPHANSGQ